MLSTSVGCVTLKNDSVAREKRWQRMQICFWPGCIDDLKVVVHDWLTDENPKIAFNSGWETERKWSRFVVPHPTILQRHEFLRFRFFLHCGTLPCCRMSRSTHASQTHSFGNGTCRAMTSDCTRMVSYVQMFLYLLVESPGWLDLSWAQTPSVWKACPAVLNVFSWVWEDCSLFVSSHCFYRKTAVEPPMSSSMLQHRKLLFFWFALQTIPGPISSISKR